MIANTTDRFKIFGMPSHFFQKSLLVHRHSQETAVASLQCCAQGNQERDVNKAKLVVGKTFGIEDTMKTGQFFPLLGA